MFNWFKNLFKKAADFLREVADRVLNLFRKTVEAVGDFITRRVPQFFSRTAKAVRDFFMPVNRDNHREEIVPAAA